MKISKIAIENIASLRGQHTIDFENFGQDNSTYAITGETGSGKSTILNSISLALYGQNYKRSLTQIDFVTLGEKSGKIILEFKYNEQFYKSIWQCKVKKNNGEDLKAPKPKRELYHYSENKWIALEKLPEDIINLSFDQFCKTMILNQGEFANFLTSSFKERKDILEKFYDGQKLELLSIKTRQKINELSQTIDNKFHQIEGLQDYSEIDIEDSKLKVKSLKQIKSLAEEAKVFLELNFDRFKDIKKYIQENQISLKRLTSLSETIKETTQEVNSAKTNLENKRKEIELFTQEYRKEEPKLLECINKSEKIVIYKNEFHTLEKEIERNNKNKVSKEEELLEVELEIKDIKEKLEFLVKDELYQEIKLDKLKPIQEKYKEFLKSTNELELSLRKKEQDLEKNIEIQKEAEAIKEKIEKITNETSDLSQKELEQREKENEINYEGISKKLTELGQFHDQQEIINQKIHNQISRLKNLENEHIELKKNSTLVMERESEVKTALKYFELLESIQYCQNENSNHKECIVCHSPLDQTPSKNIDIDFTEFENLKEKSLSLENERKLLENKQTEIKTEINNINFDIDEKKTNYIEQKRIFLNDKLLKDFSIETEETVLLNHLQKLKLKTKEENIRLKEKIILIEKTKYQINEQNEQLKQLRNKYSETKIKLSAQEKHIHSLEKPISEAKDYILTKCNIKEIKDNFSKTIELNQDFYQFQDKKNYKVEFLKKSSLDIAEIEKNQALKRKRIKELNDLMTTIKNDIEKVTKGNDPQVILSNLKEKNRVLLDEEQKINSIKTTSEVYLAELSSKFKNINEQIDSYQNQIKILISEISTSAKVSLNSSNWESEYERLNDLIKDFIPLLNKMITLSDIDYSNEDILTETIQYTQNLMKNFNDFMNTSQEEITKLNTLIKQKEDSLEKIKKIQLVTEGLLKTKNEYQDLYDLIGRDEFRNYVLSIIEKNLIIQTNHELTYLCDNRYKLIHFTKNSKMSPDFYIIDKYKGGLTRKVSTLSGGETFMVSLAMAIALSELTRGKAQINSFFIDEGFGTLDEDSLEDVLNMINNIQARGKTIGIITHVKKLADRIPLNIRLNKSSQGNSNIQLIFQ